MSTNGEPKGIVAKFGYPTLLVAVFIYTAQGLRSFASIATTLYFKNKFNFDPAELTLVGTVSYLAWYLKPIYGLISDCFPLLGYRRSSYLFLSGLLGVLSYLLLILVESPGIAIICLMLGEFSQAICDVICDGFLVERSKIDPVNGAHDLQKVSWSSLFFASMVGMICGGFAADYIQPTYLIGALALCPLLVVITSFIVPEKKVIESLSFTGKFRKVWESLKLLWRKLVEKDNLRIILFTICWQSTSVGFGAIYTYYLLDILDVQPSTLTILSFVGYLGSFIGTIFAGKGLKMGIIGRLVTGRILYNMISVFDIMLFTRGYEYLGLSFYPFLFGSSSIGSIIDMYFSRMPMLIIFTHITPLDIEATFFAALSALFNISMSLSDILASVIMYSTGINDSHSQFIWVLIVISMALGFLSLVFILFLPKSVEVTENKPGDVEEYRDIELPLLK